MLKALIKKQLMEVNTWLLQDKKKGTRRSDGGIVCYILLYLFLFGILGVVFFVAGSTLCGPFHAMGLDWLYFSLTGILAILLGVFGSVFNTFSTLYQAKDNEMLLSMPIPPKYVLMVRLLGVWTWSAIYTALAFIPCLLAFWLECYVSLKLILCGLIVFLFLTIFILFLSCILGWVVAKITSKLKNKSFVTVIASLAFIILYYFFYFRANDILQSILTNANLFEGSLSRIFPLYWMGMGGAGDIPKLLLFGGLVLVCMLLVIQVMSQSFLKLATASTSVSKKRYQKTGLRSRSLETTLLFKEMRRFTSSANYMLNCALGCLFLPALGIFALFKASTVSAFLTDTGIGSGPLVLIACAGMCLTASLNDISAPSVSLEGKHIWIVQSLPIQPFQVLKAKWKLHLILTEIPVLFCSLCICFVLHLNLGSAFLVLLISMLFVLLTGAMGLAVNLKAPNLTWKNEVVPLKQSFSVTVTLFGAWIIIFALAILYYLLRNLINPYSYLLLCAALFLAVTFALYRWLKTRGAEIFANL